MSPQEAKINKLPWFTHDHNARNDEFLQRAEDQFGHFGYAAYFKILELIHEHGRGGVLRISKTRLCQNLRSRWTQVRLYLDFSRTSDKVQYTLSGDEVELQNKKFIERQRNLKSKATSMQPQSNVKIGIYREREGDKQTAVVSKEMPRDLGGPKKANGQTEELRLLELAWNLKGAYYGRRIIDLDADYCGWALRSLTEMGDEYKKALKLRIRLKNEETSRKAPMAPLVAHAELKEMTQ